MDKKEESFISRVYQYKLPIFFGSISFFLIILSLFIFIKSSTTSSPIVFLDGQGNVLGDVSSVAIQSASTSKILVDIEGAVVNPGVVTAQIGDRVGDIIEKAGGLRNDADVEYISKSINKAMKVSDGIKIYIPSKTETSHINDCTTSGKIGDVVQSCGVVATLGKSSQNTTQISINMATKSQLETLPGVGPVTAQKIIDYRPYQTLEELVSKKAVGQSTFDKIKDSIMP